MKTYRASSIIVGLVVVAYLLSPGPVISYYRSRSRPFPPAVFAVFAPVDLACREIDWVDKAYDAYFAMWGVN
jgi:hypothetical protein